jgi:hypothetical protein
MSSVNAPASQAPPILHLSAVVGSPLRDADGERLGKVEDLIVRLGGAGYPPITGLILLSAFVAMIPGVPVISLLVGVQVVNGLLLPINLFFIWRLARSHSVMGERRSRGLLDGAAGVTVAVTSTLSLGLVVVTIAGL